MKLETLQEAKYAHGKTLDRVLQYFDFKRMTYGPGGEELPIYDIKNEFVAHIRRYGSVTDAGKTDHNVDSITPGEDEVGKYVHVNFMVHGNSGSGSYPIDKFLQYIEIYKKNRVI